MSGTVRMGEGGIWGTDRIGISERVVQETARNSLEWEDLGTK